MIQAGIVGSKIFEEPAITRCRILQYSYLTRIVEVRIMTESVSGSSREPYSLLSPDGSLDEDRLDGDLDETFLEDFYRQIWYARLADRRVVNLQRQGQLGTYAPL